VLVVDEGFVDDSVTVGFDSVDAGFASEDFDSDGLAVSLVGLSVESELADGLDA
jgi:hypothetical protein